MKTQKKRTPSAAAAAAPRKLRSQLCALLAATLRDPRRLDVQARGGPIGPALGPGHPSARPSLLAEQLERTKHEAPPQGVPSLK